MSFSRNFGLPFCAVLALFVWPSTAREKEKKIHRSDLPPAVEKTVAAESVAGSTIRGFSREQESGKVCYEAEMTVNGHSKDLLIAPDGSIVEVEEEVAFDSLSRAIQAGLQSKAGAGKILKIESI